MPLLKPEQKVRLIKRSFSLAGHRTSVALEPEFWEALQALAGTERLLALVAAVDAARAPGQPLASALRVFALRRGNHTSLTF